MLSLPFNSHMTSHKLVSLSEPQFPNGRGEIIDNMSAAHKADIEVKRDYVYRILSTAPRT